MNTPSIQSEYEKACKTRTDIYVHLPKLRALADEYRTVLECGFRNGESTLAFLAGAAGVTSIDIEPCAEGVARIDALCPIHWEFKQADSLKFKADKYGLVFLDTLHEYEHLRKELSKYSKKAQCIAIHDTDARWEKKGRTRSAIKDFLKANPSWKEVYHNELCNGLTVISCV